MLKDDEFSCSVLLKLLIAGTGAGKRMKLLSLLHFSKALFEQLLPRLRDQRSSSLDVCCRPTRKRRDKPACSFLQFN
jgi:hypothetical protein